MNTDERARRDAAIIAEYERGDPVAEIATRYGVDGPAVSRIAHAAGYGRRLTGQAREQRDQEIARLFRGGASWKEIAAELGVTQIVIKNALAAQNVPMRYDQRPVPMLTPEETALRHERMRAMRASGAAPYEIASAFGVSITTVRRIVRGVVPGASGTPPKPGGLTHEATIDPNLVALVIDRYRAGVPIAELERMAGITHPIIMEIVHRAGIPLRKVNWTLDEDAWLATDKRDAEIATILGRTTVAVRSRRKYLAERQSRLS